jgi:hypothetical protein
MNTAPSPISKNLLILFELMKGPLEAGAAGSFMRTGKDMA